MSTDDKNPQAALIEQYCRDWQETAEPWLRWEVEMEPGEWAPLVEHPIWSEPYKYRRRPNTIKVNEVEVNAPLKVAPPLGTAWWPADHPKFECYQWQGDEVDERCLAHGIACATQEDAKALLLAMNAPLRAYVNGGGK